jgi:hypothetical protein
LEGGGWGLFLNLSLTRQALQYDVTLRDAFVTIATVGKTEVVYIMSVMWRVWGRIEVCTGCWWGSLRERGYWGDQDVEGRIILR